MADQKPIPWLIKSGGHIFGPYKKEELEQKLLSRDFVVLDEVARPTRRWRYIRDEEAFAKVVEEMRIKNLKLDDQTATGTLGSVTMTQSVTEPIGRFSDELTPKAQFENKQDPTPSEPVRVAAYGMVGDQAVQKKAKKTIDFMWLVTLLVIFGVGGFVAYEHFLGAPQKQEKFSVDHVALAEEAISVGNFISALENYKRAYELDPLNETIYLYLGLLLIQIDNDTLQAKRILNKVKDPSLRKRVQLGLGLAHMVEEKWKAAEANFNETLVESPNDLEALVNLAAIHLQQGEYEKASDVFDRTGQQFYSKVDGASVLMRAEANIFKWREANDPQELEKAGRLLNDYLQIGSDYLQESELMLVYLRNLTTNKTDSEETELIKVLNRDPDLTSQHSHNPWIYRRYIDRQVYSFWCGQLLDGYPDGIYRQALRSYCHLRMGREVRAREVIENALNQQPKDALLNSIYAYTLDVSGLELEASAALGKANELNNLRSEEERLELPLLLQARFNQDSGDDQGAMELWRAILRKQPKSVAAMSGIGWGYLKSKNLKESKNYYERGLKVSKYYRPLLELASELRERGVLPGG